MDRIGHVFGGYRVWVGGFGACVSHFATYFGQKVFKESPLVSALLDTTDTLARTYKKVLEVFTGKVTCSQRYDKTDRLETPHNT